MALLEDLPAENLWRGQIGAVVEVYDDGQAFEVEFVDADGQTYGLLALRSEQLMLCGAPPLRKLWFEIFQSRLRNIGTLNRKKCPIK